MPDLMEIFDYLWIAWHWVLLGISLLGATFLPTKILSKILLATAVTAIWTIFGSGLIGSAILIGINSAVAKKRDPTVTTSGLTQLVGVFILLISIGVATVFSVDHSDSTESTSFSPYDASIGLHGAIENIPVPPSSTVTLQQEWNTFSVSPGSQPVQTTGYRWTLEPDLPINEVEQFYQSMNPPPAKDTSFNNPTYSFKMGASNIEVEIIKEDAQFVITENIEKAAIKEEPTIGSKETMPLPELAPTPDKLKKKYLISGFAKKAGVELAVINGRIVSEGEYLTNELKIHRIHNGVVEVLQGKKLYTLRLRSIQL